MSCRVHTGYRGNGDGRSYTTDLSLLNWLGCRHGSAGEYGDEGEEAHVCLRWELVDSRGMMIVGMLPVSVFWDSGRAGKKKAGEAQGKDGATVDDDPVLLI